jgi:ABC-2 type transport system permease protein
MSTATASPELGRGPARQLSRVPFSRLVKVELRKAYDTRAGFWLIVAIAAVTLLGAVIYLFAAGESEMTMWNFVGVAATPQGFLLPVLGVLAITSEWSQRTGLVTFTLEPSRGRALASKVTAVLILGALAVVLVVVFAALANAVAPAFGGDGTWDFGPDRWLAVFVLQVTGLLIGVAFGMILQNSAAAIVLYYVVPLAFSIIFGLISALEDAAPWIDFSTAQQPLFGEDTVTAKEWLQMLVTSIWWVVLPLAAGVWRALRSEVK